MFVILWSLFNIGKNIIFSFRYFPCLQMPSLDGFAWSANFLLELSFCYWLLIRSFGEFFRFSLHLRTSVYLAACEWFWKITWGSAWEWKKYFKLEIESALLSLLPDYTKLAFVIIEFHFLVVLFQNVGMRSIQYTMWFGSLSSPVVTCPCFYNLVSGCSWSVGNQCSFSPFVESFSCYFF